MSTTHWIVFALSALPSAAQQAATPQPSAGHVPVAMALTADTFEALAAMASPAPRSSARARAGSVAAIYGAMRDLAAQGNGRAAAWCARRLGSGSSPSAEESIQLFGALVREHADAAWLRAPEFDPEAALERADLATRKAVAAALVAEVFQNEGARQLALLLEAAALAPTHAREGALAAQALARLDELRAAWPAGPWAGRAADLAWRIEHLAPGRTAPALVLRDVDGNELAVEDWRGGDLLIDVWRIDDPDRAAHAAELAALLTRVRALRPQLGLRVLGIGLGDEEIDFRRELEELELPWPTAFERGSDGPARSAWRLDGRPTTLWLDAEGVLRARGGSLAELEAHLLAPPEPMPEANAEPLRGAPDDETSNAAARSERRES